MWPSKICTAAALVGVVAGADVSRREAPQQQQQQLRASVSRSDESLMEPISFEQKLLVCNAYPSENPITVQQEGGQVLAGSGDALRYKECRYLTDKVKKQDKIDFGLLDMEVQGTFEIDHLPSTDATLLLVVQKKPTSPMLSFTSYAFQASADTKDAQIAVIDAYAGKSDSMHMKMEDYVADKKNSTRRRAEELAFNRIYSIEAGNYDASVMDPHRAPEDESEVQLEKGTRRAMRLAGSPNFVLLRTGGGAFEESLTVFPDLPIQVTKPDEAPSSLTAWSAHMLASLKALKDKFHW